MLKKLIVALGAMLVAGCGDTPTNKPLATYDPCFVATKGQDKYAVRCSWAGSTSIMKTCMEQKGIRVTVTREAGLDGKVTFHIENQNVSPSEVVKQANITRECIRNAQ